MRWVDYKSGDYFFCNIALGNDIYLYVYAEQRERERKKREGYIYL